MRGVMQVRLNSTFGKSFTQSRTYGLLRLSFSICLADFNILESYIMLVTVYLYSEGSLGSSFDFLAHCPILMTTYGPAETLLLLLLLSRFSCVQLCVTP